MNPVEIERQLETLKESLANWASPRLKLLTICDFVAEFQHSMSLLQSYLIEFIDGLAGLLKTSSLVGIDPARLLPLVDGLEYVQANLPSSFESTAISEVITILREQIASLYLSVGEIDAAVMSLQSQWQKIPADFCRHDAQQDVPAMESTIDERILRIDSQYDEIKGKLHNLAKHTSQSPGSNAVCSYFPVIERPAGHATDMAEEGALRRICISILGFANGDEDELIFEFQAVQNGDDARKQFSEPLAAARVLLAKNFPRLRNCYFIFRITLDNPSYLHDGNSASLASAALFYTAILNFVNLHISYSIPANVAMSGGIGPDGCILPVSEATLDKKIAAGFFSPVRYLAIPESQKAKSERLLERYKDIYPQKDFSIVACERLDDVFYDRRLTQDRRVSAPVYLARQAWRHRSPIGITAIFALLLTILAFMLYGPLDKNPTNAVFFEGIVQIRNAHEQTLEEIWVGEKSANYINNESNLANNYMPRIAFRDVTGDGINEVFYAQLPPDSEDGNGMIFCRDIMTGTNLWRFSVQPETNFLNHPAVSSEKYSITNFVMGDFDGDAKDELFLVAHQGYFPSAVIKLDAQTGKKLGQYMHIGHLKAIRPIDLNNDGIVELLIPGVNNAFRNGCLLVLDPRYVEGFGPHTRNYQPAAASAGSEIAYLLFPKSIVGAAFSDIDKANEVVWKNDKQNGAYDFALVIRDYETVDFHMFFGLNLQPKYGGTSDLYDMTAEKLYYEGKIEKLPDKEYWREYMQSIHYWNGESFQSQPTFTKNYAPLVSKSTEK